MSRHVPPGWKTSTASNGEFSREVQLNRGNAMQLASQEAQRCREDRPPIAGR
jgi:hypothetical protein